jgi:16S rRNA (uracil1498-N3)-methyltransferase
MEKCTELGVAEFILFKSEFGEIDELSKNRLERIILIVISAMKQCGRLDLPSVTIINKLSELKNKNYIFLFGEENSLEYLDINTLRKVSQPICFLTGPEKGFSEKELEFMKEELRASQVKINNNILRAETAPITAAALLSQLHFIPITTEKGF